MGDWVVVEGEEFYKHFWVPREEQCQGDAVYVLKRHAGIGGWCGDAKDDKENEGRLGGWWVVECGCGGGCGRRGGYREGLGIGPRDSVFL